MKWNFLSKGIKSENHDNQYTIYVYTTLAGIADIFRMEISQYDINVYYIETYSIVH